MLDYFGRRINYLRLSITDFCNLRCRYCMPDEGVMKKEHSDILTEDEMINAIKIAASLGINKLRITGGEPLVKKNIISICERSSKVDGIDDLGITTNGTLLNKYAKDLKNAGVNRINISLDTLVSEKYESITRYGKIEDVFNGIETVISVGFEKIKINVVLIGGFNDDEIVSLAELTREYPLDLRFIELMPMCENEEFQADAYISCNAVLEKIPELISQNNLDGVARMYKLPKARGCIGLISPLSSHFCDTCNRIRLTADGKLKPCLHSSVEYSIKGLNLEGVRRQFERAIFTKPEWHGKLSSQDMSRAGRMMNQIGG